MSGYRFTLEDVLNLIVERNGEIHEGLDARILAEVEGTDSAVVAFVPPGAIGEPSETEHFLVRVERIPAARTPKEN